MYLSSHESTFKPFLMPPDFQSNLCGLTLIMLPKFFKALAGSNVIILTSLSLFYHYIAITLLLNFELWHHFWKCWHMQKIQIITAEVLLCNILNVWFQTHFYSCHLCLRNKKVINFQIYPTLVQENCWHQQKKWYLVKNVVITWCWTVWSIFVHNLVTIQWTPPTYLTFKKCKPCWVNNISGNFKISNQQVTEVKREIKGN